MHGNRSLTVKEFPSLVINGQFLFKTVCCTLRSGQEKPVARVLHLLCHCAGRRFRKLVRIHKQIRDVADGVHIEKDDL